MVLHIAVFSSPQDGFGLWLYDLQFEGSTVTLFDSGNNQIGVFDLLAIVGTAAPRAWRFTGFSSSAGDVAATSCTRFVRRRD